MAEAVSVAHLDMHDSGFVEAARHLLIGRPYKIRPFAAGHWLERPCLFLPFDNNN